MSILSKFVEFFVSRWKMYKWMKANTLSSNGKLLEAIDIYQSLDLRDGLKQIALVQTADIYYLLGQNGKAKQLYKEAQISERQWGMRSKTENSQYIIEYCNYFLAMVEVDTVDEKLKTRALKQLVILSNIPVSRDIKVYYLPLPVAK